MLALRLRPALLCLVALLVVGAAAASWLGQRRQILGAMAALGMGWFGAVIAITAGACEVQDLFSARDIAAMIRREAPAGVPVYSVQNYPQSLTFYLKRTVTLVDYRDEFALGLRQAPRSGIASLGEFGDRWRALNNGIAVMPPATRARLTDAGVPMREVACVAKRLCVMSRH